MAGTRKRMQAGTPQVRQQLAVIASEHPALIQAYAHPLRVSILALFDDGASELSPVEIAKTLDAPLGNVSYHVRILADLGIIRCTRTSPARGAVAHHYKLS